MPVGQVSVKNISSKPVSKDEAKLLISSLFCNEESLHIFTLVKTKVALTSAKRSLHELKQKTSFNMTGFSTEILHAVIKRDITGLYMWKEKGCFAFFVESTTLQILKIKPKSSTWMPRYDISVKLLKSMLVLPSARHQSSLNFSVECPLFKLRSTGREKVREDVYRNAFLSLYWTTKEDLRNCKFVRPLKLRERLDLPDIDLFRHRSASSSW